MCLSVYNPHLRDLKKRLTHVLIFLNFSCLNMLSVIFRFYNTIPIPIYSSSPVTVYYFDGSLIESRHNYVIVYQ